MSSLRRLLGHTAIYGLSTILGRVVNWLLTPLFTGSFNLEEMGMLTDLYSYTTYFLVILTFGMETAYFRFSNDNRTSEYAYNHAFFLVSVLGMVFLVLFSLINQPLAGVLGYGDHPNLLMWVVVIIFLDVLAAIPMARLRHDEKPMRFATISLVNIGLNIFLSILFIAYLQKGIEWVFIANAIASLARLLMVLPDTLPRHWRFEEGELKEMATYGFFIMITGLAGMLNMNLDKNLIPNLWPENGEFHGRAMTGFEVNGLYGAANRLAMIVSIVTQAFRYAAEPFFFKKAGEKDSKEALALVFHYFVLSCIGIGFLTSMFAGELAGFNLFGLLRGTLIHEKFWEGLGIVPVLVLAYVLLAAYTQITIWFKITKQTRFGLFYSMIGVMITLVLDVVMIPFTGYVGAAWATVICFGVMLWLGYRGGRKYYPIPYQVNRLFVYSAICLIAWFMVFLTDDITFLGKILWAMLAAAFVGILEWKFPVRQVLTQLSQRREARQGSNSGPGQP